MPRDGTPVTTRAHIEAAAAGAERREKPLTNSQIAIGIMRGFEALVRANPVARDKAVSSLFEPTGPGLLMLELDYSGALSEFGYHSATFINYKQDERDVRELNLEHEERGFGEQSEFQVSVSIGPNGKDQGFLKNDPDGVRTGSKTKLDSARKRGLELLAALNDGEISVADMSGFRLPAYQRHIPSELFTTDVLGIARVGYDEASAAWRTNQEEDSLRAEKAVQEIAAYGARVIGLGGGQNFKGFRDDENGFREEVLPAVLVSSLEPFKELEQPFRTPSGKLMTRVDVFVLADGLHFVYTGKDGINWGQEFNPRGYTERDKDRDILRVEQAAMRAIAGAFGSIIHRFH